MTKTKEVSVSIDIEELERQLDEKREEEEPKRGKVEVRSTIFSVGKDPRVGTKVEISTPDLRFAELLKDGLENPYVELNWRIPRHNVDAAGVVGFNIYKRELTREEIENRTRDKKRRLRRYSRSAIDRISRSIPAHGKFSSERKAIYHIKRDLIPSVSLNSNLSQAERAERMRFESSFGSSFSRPGINSNLQNDPSIILRGRFDRYLTNKSFVKIGYVDYTKFLAQEKKKFVSVTHREFIDLTFKDKVVGYGESFEYYVTCISEDSRSSIRSNVVALKIEDVSGVRPPVFLSANQANENTIQVVVKMNPADDVGKIIFYRKAEDEIFYNLVASAENINDTVNLADSTVKYGKSYSYRVFLENIHGTLSEPREIQYVSSVQKITPQSRSNNLKIPIITAVQDQNSEFIKITISPNDPYVSFYVLERRDLTVHERSFSVPGRNIGEIPRDVLVFGDTGWETNHFFVDRKRSIFEETATLDRDLLNKRAIEKEIIFTDNTVTPDHIYQYRTYGCDLFNNQSSYALTMARSTGKKSIRTPINLKSEILRGNPVRVKISWDDDNLATAFSASELFSQDSQIEPPDNKFIYRAQRRKRGEHVYETFPLTANNFLVDEAPSLDAVDLTPKKVDDTYVKSENIETEDDTIKLLEKELHRPFGVPDFLKENDIYFYRISSMNNIGDKSNFTREIEVSTLPELSNPVEFKVEVSNTRSRPLIARLSWGIEKTKSKADHYVIERKFDSVNDSFEVIGRSYLETEFYDRDIKPSSNYIYRIKAIDTLQRESEFFEARLTI